MITLQPLPDHFATTRDDLHAVAEHVLGPLRYEVEGHIGLRPTPHGFGTETLGLDRQVRVVDGILVDSDRDGERRERLTTIAGAAAFVGVPPGAIAGLYTPTTDGDPHRPLQIDRTAATVLGEWFTFGAVVLTRVHEGAGPDDTPTLMQLWPEHFDLAIDLGPEGHRVNVGASPGDAAHPEPYLYVGPWGERRDDPIWNEPFGASLAYADLLASADSVEDAVAWIERARAAI